MPLLVINGHHKVFQLLESMFLDFILFGHTCQRGVKFVQVGEQGVERLLNLGFEFFFGAFFGLFYLELLVVVLLHHFFLV